VFNSCNAGQQNSLVQMTLDLLFEVVVTAVNYSTAVQFDSLSYCCNDLVVTCRLCLLVESDFLHETFC